MRIRKEEEVKRQKIAEEKEKARLEQEQLVAM